MPNKELLFDPNAGKIFKGALRIVDERKDEYITPEHIILSFIENDEDFVDVLETLKGQKTVDDIEEDIENVLDDLDKIEKREDIKESNKFQQMVVCMMLLSAKNGIVKRETIIQALDKINALGKTIFSKYGIYISDILTGMAAKQKVNGAVTSEPIYREEEEDTVRKQEKSKKGWRKLVTCLNDEIEFKTIPFIGREAEIERISQILCRATKNNPILVGEPGVGKTAIVEGLAKKINEGSSVNKLENAEIYSLDLGDLIAGTQFRGEFENKLKGVLEGLSKEVENPILYIDEIHNLVGLGAGSGSSLDGANLIKRYSTEGKIKFIGTTTYEEYKKHFTKDKALDRRFKKVDVAEPSVEDCIKIINGIKSYYENFHNVVYSKEAIEQAVILSDKYINNRFLPDKAIDLIDEAGANNSMNSSEEVYKVTKLDIENILAKTCNIPKKTMESDDISTLMNLESNIKKNVFGQDEAAKQLVNSIKLSRAGLSDQNKPVASLLFVGPTGVGKTEIAKTVANLLYGNEDKLIRFDMSEYMEEHSVSKLIGSPAGYVGYDDGGLLVDKIIQNPSCVLLLDEIEKAHPKVFNALLQVMDYAVLTDNKGRKADFRNVVIIMTSNAGAHCITKNMGFASSSTSVNTSGIMDAVKNTFTPEFRNRLTKVIVFNPMDDNMGKLIVDKQLNILSDILRKKNVKVKYSEKIKTYLLEKGISQNFGAREIQRIVENEIKPLFIDELLDGKLKNGGNALIDLNEGIPTLTIKETRKTKKEKELS